MRLVLASTSTYRRDLLARLGLAFEQRAPDVDEEAWKAKGAGPRELARQLAAAKARAVADALGDAEAVVIGSDQVCAVGDRVLGKPGDAAGALEQLRTLRGRSHEILTAVCVVGPGGDWEHTDVARLFVRDLDDAALERYVAADEPYDCAGSYKLEARGIALFEAIECADHTAIVGLPLMALAGDLARRGFRLP
ncbi:Maf-like protein YceF [Planctomycetes bacterium Pla163]|uniref:7-methyl-GTP pyrophosphatase n=1 Tax=Rohdeia mirabilis TaxID=2528008 RepID=A0A518CVZ3_9BACT|nr:Maf-like protein YceF [Planctomycetes bacterium Pla163]